MMDEFTIYCTEEQTKKARELGAPIEIKTIEEAQKDWQGKAFFTGMATCAKLPTAEQMIGWIESFLTIQLLIEKQMGESGTRYRIWVRDECKPFSDIIEMHNYPTRKEATLAAIDAALEYLENLINL